MASKKTKAAAAAKAATDEDELINQYIQQSPASGSRRPSVQQRAFYFVCAILVAVVPIYLYWSIFELDLQKNLPIFGVVTAFVAGSLSIAYHNVALSTTVKLMKEREGSLTGKSAAGKREPLEVRRKALEAATGREAAAYAIVYNNALFLAASVILSFWVFSNAAPTYNYILSLAFSAGVITLVSSA